MVISAKMHKEKGKVAIFFFTAIQAMSQVISLPLESLYLTLSHTNGNYALTKRPHNTDSPQYPSGQRLVLMVAVKLFLI